MAIAYAGPWAPVELGLRIASEGCTPGRIAMRDSLDRILGYVTITITINRLLNPRLDFVIVEVDTTHRLESRSVSASIYFS